MQREDNDFDRMITDRLKPKPKQKPEPEKPRSWPYRRARGKWHPPEEGT